MSGAFHNILGITWHQGAPAKRSPSPFTRSRAFLPTQSNNMCPPTFSANSPSACQPALSATIHCTGQVTCPRVHCSTSSAATEPQQHHSFSQRCHSTGSPTTNQGDLPATSFRHKAESVPNILRPCCRQECRCIHPDIRWALFSEPRGTRCS